MERYYRIQPADRDPDELLRPDKWVSAIWVGTAYKQCPDCAGTGEIDDDVCGTCDGAGEIDDSERRGVSCCRSLESLHRYFADRGAMIEDCVMIELEGEESEDEDWDAEEGAVLVYPTRIVSVGPIIAAVR